MLSFINELYLCKNNYFHFVVVQKLFSEVKILRTLNELKKYFKSVYRNNHCNIYIKTIFASIFTHFYKSTT